MYFLFYSLYFKKKNNYKLCIYIYIKKVVHFKDAYKGQSSQKTGITCQKSDLIGIMMHQT